MPKFHFLSTWNIIRFTLIYSQQTSLFCSFNYAYMLTLSLRLVSSISQPHFVDLLKVNQENLETEKYVTPTEYPSKFILKSYLVILKSYLGHFLAYCCQIRQKICFCIYSISPKNYQIKCILPLQISIKQMRIELFIHWPITKTSNLWIFQPTNKL